MKHLRAALQRVKVSDLRDWAGETILRRGRQYVKQVAELSRTAQGELAALVSGRHLYTTVVYFHEDGAPGGLCSCPYECGPCKHAVAVILAAAEMVRQDEEIPLRQETDDLWYMLPKGPAAAGDEDDDLSGPGDPGGSMADQRKSAKTIGKILAGKSRADLLALLKELAGLYPEVARRIRETAALDAGQVDGIVRALQREIMDITAPLAYYNPWTQEGCLPDYFHVQEQMAALLARGHADAVVGLAEVIWRRGREQVAHAQDEGETGILTATCLDVVFQALPQSSLPPAQQLQWVIERLLEDKFGLLESAVWLLEDEAYTPAHWQEVAAWLVERLAAMPVTGEETFESAWSRAKIVHRLIDAYRRAGWRERIIPLLEQEVHHCRLYNELVDALLDAGRRPEARHWCIVGIERTRRPYPGIAKELQDRLKKSAGREKKRDLVAAYLAEDFFNDPSRRAYKALQKSTEKIGCWPAVRAGILCYLETGQRPDSTSPRKGSDAWPLPPTEVVPAEWPARYFGRSFPWLEMLIDLAILEKRWDDVVRLYAAYRKDPHWFGETDKAVAAAVVESHPDVSLGIWRAMVEDRIAAVKAKAYDEAAIYLRQMRRLYEKLDRTAEWRAVIADLRLKHKAERRLMSVLDGLER